MPLASSTTNSASALPSYCGTSVTTRTRFEPVSRSSATRVADTVDFMFEVEGEFALDFMA